MFLYITREQANSMRIRPCLRCGKTLDIAFWQITPSMPVVLSVSEDGIREPVRIQDWCTCQDKPTKIDDV